MLPTGLSRGEKTLLKPMQFLWIFSHRAMQADLLRSSPANANTRTPDHAHPALTLFKNSIQQPPKHIATALRSTIVQCHKTQFLCRKKLDVGEAHPQSRRNRVGSRHACCQASHLEILG